MTTVIGNLRRVIRVEPMGAPRQVRSDKWKPRDCILRYRAFRDIVRLQVRTLPDQLRVRFHISMPPSWTAKKREAMCGQPHRTKPDIDNLCKALMDAVMVDDKSIWRIEAEKVWSHEGSIEIVL